MDDLLSEFLTETTESLDVVDSELVKFEQEPNNSAILDNIFRLVHTIKGTCGFLGLPRLEALAHAAETLMGKFRDGMAVTPEAVSLILASIDQIKVILGDLEQNEEEPEGSDTDLISRLDLMSLGKQAQSAAADPADSADDADAPAPTCEAEIVAAAPMDGDAAAINVVERETKPGEVSLEDLERAFQEAEAPEGMDYTRPATFEAEDKQPAPEPVAPEPVAIEAAGQPEGKKAKSPEPASSEAAPAGAKKESLSTQSIRVNVDTIEHLITMVSELVLTRNQLLEIERQHAESKFKVPLQRLSNVTAELQEGVMKTRMQPIGNAWQKLPRIVRDLAQELDKKIELVMNGAATELDRQVLELIKDPLTHMVRNSADHGLETTQGRIDAGKSEVGTVTLSAFHEGGYIIIEIADDGRGLNTAKLKAKILENGIISEAEMEKLSEAQIHNYVFNAGLSTAEKVTSVSGRGVGMDVVRTNIELIGGSIELKSTEGVGTTFKIKIPLTLAIVSALIVESSGTRYAIPQLSVIELVRAQAGSDHRIEMIKDTPVLRLRNKLLPLIHLNKLLQVEKPKSNIVEPVDSAIEDTGSVDVAGAETPAAKKPRDKASEDKNVHENGFIVVTQVGSQNFGIVVDAVFHTEEIVVKPMSSMLRDIAMFSGNTILGDGSVIMIIDPNGIAQTVGADISEEEEDKAARAALVPNDSERTTSMLLFRSQSGENKAVPLALVTRLEETGVENIEASNDRYMIQYREHLMPLIYIDPTAKPKEEGVQQFLVFADNERTMGLAVEQIVDIVDEKLNIEIASENDGVLGSAVIKGKATEVVDIAYYLPQAFADWFDRKEFDQGKFAKKVLLVDDSAFFRNMLSPVLKASGYAVTSVESVREALELREAGVKFDAIVSDIEMPDTNGFEFAEMLRNDDVWGNIPLIALSSHCSQAALERGRQAGFHDYVAKFDREGLIETLRQSHVAIGEAA
ncbi:MAG: hybrid sensor histidine kinase/response regulator [Fimbriimonadaceae bacterium]|nr:hybrid sensor histidine kinase/response regulator [Alphaproteobacteria bacterium]